MGQRLRDLECETEGWFSHGHEGGTANLTIPTTKLNVNSLNSPLERQRSLEDKKSKNHTMEFYLTIKRNKALINFEAKPQKHAEWEKQNAKDYVLYFHLCEKFREGKFTETENRLVVAKGRRWEWGFNVKEHKRGTSLVVQWLRLHTPNAGALSLIPGQRTRSHILQLRLGTAGKKKKSTKKLIGVIEIF